MLVLLQLANSLRLLRGCLACYCHSCNTALTLLLTLCCPLQAARHTCHNQRRP